MAEKSQLHRDNLSVFASETSCRKNFTRSFSSIAATSSRPNQQANYQPSSSNTESRQVVQTSSKIGTRNFSFALNTTREAPNKGYLKNSEKTIKPPEKATKSGTKAISARPIPLQRQRTATLLSRNNSTLKKSSIPRRNNEMTGSASARLTAGKRSLTCDIINPLKSPRPTYAHVDIKSIEELARRLENLQTIFVNKLELFYSREPNAPPKTFKLVAMVIGENAKLLVNESAAQRLPNSIPARSIEDLNIKISKFFTGCLLAFTDKLRQFQSENRAINCDEIYKELKRDEEVYSAILKDWVSEMCVDADVTLTWTTQASIAAVPEQQEIATQTETDSSTHLNTSSKDLLDLITIRVEISELKFQLREKDANHEEELRTLKEGFESKIDDLAKSLQIEQTISAAKEAKVKKILELNETLTKELEETKTQFEILTEEKDQLNLKVQKESELSEELKKVREELDKIRQENQDLNESKMNYLRKLNRRATRIDLLEKEIKQHKRKTEVQNKEIDDLKREFDAKVKENREYKESLDARNQLIDHLRRAIEIEQRKRKEVEENLVNTASNAGNRQSADGIRFVEPTLEKKFINKTAEIMKRNFHEIPIAMNFTEGMPGNTNGPISSTPTNFEIAKRNIFDFKMPKKDSCEDDSSEEKRLAAKDQRRLRSARLYNIKKY